MIGRGTDLARDPWAVTVHILYGAETTGATRAAVVLSHAISAPGWRIYYPANARPEPEPEPKEREARPKPGPRRPPRRLSLAAGLSAL